jgi:regulator of RNase E activity RraA
VAFGEGIVKENQGGWADRIEKLDAPCSGKVPPIHWQSIFPRPAAPVEAGYLVANRRVGPSTINRQVEPGREESIVADLWTTYAPHVKVLSSAALADILDGLGNRNSALPPYLRPLRPEWKVFGRAATLEAAAVAAEPERPYAVELECIDALGTGDVLVAATGNDQSSALWGELLSTASRAHGAVGAVIDGLTRDAEKILAMDFPVFASGYSPLDSKGRLDGVSHGGPVQIGACTVNVGDWVFGDIDGVVIIPAALVERALPLALEKVTGENRVRAELARGRSVREVFAEYRIL